MRGKQKTYSIHGKVTNKSNGRGILGLRVEVWDKNLVLDDFIGEPITDSNGEFSLTFQADRFRSIFDRDPDLYFKVYHNDKLIRSTENEVMWNIKQGDVSVVIEVEVDEKVLVNEERIREQYNRIQAHEHHFNNVESKIREFSSAWLLAAFGAIAFLVRGAHFPAAGDPKVMVDAKLLIALVGLMGTFGVYVLWILEQRVYQRLLRAVFLLGLRLEYRYPDILPPIRTLMIRYSRTKNWRGIRETTMAKHIRWFYILPMFVLAAIASIFSISYLYQNWTTNSSSALILAAMAIGLVAPMIVLQAYLGSENMETYEEVARDFDDTEFLDYLSNNKYEDVLKKH